MKPRQHSHRTPGSETSPTVPMKVPRLVIAGWILTAPFSSAEIIGGVAFPHGVVSFADRAKVISEGNPAATAGNYKDVGRTTGSPDFVSPTGSYSLGRGGSIEVEFVNNGLTGSGNSDPDLHIFEIGPDIEDTFVDISKDGKDWVSIGKVYGLTPSIDIDQFGYDTDDQFFFVRLRDDPDQGDQTGTTVGADIDAVGAISSVPVLHAPPLHIRRLGSAAYSTIVIDHGPLAYWRLNEASGNVARNLGSLGSAADGTYGPHAALDTPGLRPNTTDSALGFPFASTHSGMLVEGFPMPPDSMSLSFLLKGDNPGNPCLFGYGAGSSPNEFSLFSEAGNLVLYLNGNRLDFPALNVMDGDPHQLAITWTKNGGILRIYLDGDPAASAVTSDGLPLESNGVFVLGQDLDNLNPPDYGFNSGQAYVGTIDEFSYYDRELSPEEVQEQWSATSEYTGITEFALESSSAAGSIYQIRGSENLELWELIEQMEGTGGPMRLIEEKRLEDKYFYHLMNVSVDF